MTMRDIPVEREVRRDFDRDMVLGLAGIMAASVMTLTAYDVFMKRTAAATGIDVTTEVSDSFIAALDLPSLEDNRTVDLVMRVYADVSAMLTCESKDDKG